MDEPRCADPLACFCLGQYCPRAGDDRLDEEPDDDSFGDRPMVTEWALAEAGLL